MIVDTGVQLKSEKKDKSVMLFFFHQSGLGQCSLQ
jgi:hypothetical protein